VPPSGARLKRTHLRPCFAESFLRIGRRYWRRGPAHDRNVEGPVASAVKLFPTLCLIQWIGIAQCVVDDAFRPVHGFPGCCRLRNLFAILFDHRLALRTIAK